MIRRNAFVGLLAVAVGIAMFASSPRVQAQQPGAAAMAIDSDDIGGVVTSAKGPEAGVWVIAETSDLPTGFRKIVVTDDRGRYVVPDLPAATYRVWVRGYGLVDSKPVQLKPGQRQNLTAVSAPSPIAAAQYYPANYWYSLIRIPPKSAFPINTVGVGFGNQGNQPITIANQLDWITRMKNDIQLNQVGDKATREIPEKLGRFKTSLEAWDAWLKVEPPVNVNNLDRQRAVSMYADWTDRIQAGEVPAAPPRPQGVERNVVITQWDVSNNKAFIHDVITTDTRTPTLNPNGIVYGPEQFSSDEIVALDPVKHSWVRFPVPMRDETMKPNFGRKAPLTWGEEEVWPAKMRLHNMMMDKQGRFWITGRFRKNEDQPPFCLPGSTHPSAKYHTVPRNGDLMVEVYDPKTKQFQMIDTCVAGHHLQFVEDANDTLWMSNPFTSEIGYINTKLWDETHDDARAQGWCAYVLDTNGNGKADLGWAEPTQPGRQQVGFQPMVKGPVDPTRDVRVNAVTYGHSVNQVDGSVWGGTLQSPGYIVRVSKGDNPPETCVTELYNSPAGLSAPKSVFVDRTGLVWVAFSGSTHFASFDRSKCQVLRGPTAIGDQCPDGWTVYAQPGPKFKGVEEEVGTDWYYLNWVDQFDTLGLGKNIPMAPGTNSDSIVAFKPETKEWVVIRVPYPLGFYSRGMDGRIDDPAGGWKGKGLWTNYAAVKPWNMEGGKGMTPKYVKFQIRPDPLAH